MSPIRPRNPVRPLAIWIGGQPWLPRHAGWIPKLDLLVRRITFGRFGLLAFAGLPQVFLTVAGRTSGVLRTTPLLCTPEGDGWLVVGSNWGQDKPPAWVGNLLAAQTAEVEFKGRRTTVVPTRLSGADRAAAWERALEVWPNYARYERRTDRELLVFRLSPVR